MSASTYSESQHVSHVKDVAFITQSRNKNFEDLQYSMSCTQLKLFIVISISGLIYETENIFEIGTFYSAATISIAESFNIQAIWPFSRPKYS